MPAAALLLALLFSTVATARASSITWDGAGTSTVSSLGTGQTPAKATFVFSPSGTAAALVAEDTITITPRNAGDDTDVMLWLAGARSANPPGMIVSQSCTVQQASAAPVAAKSSEVSRPPTGGLNFYSLTVKLNATLTQSGKVSS